MDLASDENVRLLGAQVIDDAPEGPRYSVDPQTADSHGWREPSGRRIGAVADKGHLDMTGLGKAES
jgi:hypothetical protein